MAAKKKTKKTGVKPKAKAKATKSATKARAKAHVKKPAKKLAKPPVKAASARKVKAAAAPRVNAVVHWEIQSQQAETLHRFYGEVFGWKINADNPMKYGMVASKGATGIDGGIGVSEHPSRVVVYVSVKDIPTTLESIEARGGRTIMPRTDLGMVIMALYLDPEGNTMGLVEDA
jgi:predicted enzyme related to lactoylglutathione lyase